MAKKQKAEMALVCKISTYNKQASVDFIPILLKILLKRTSVANYTLFHEESQKQYHLNGTN